MDRLPAATRRRWVLAAATTGVVLTNAAVAEGSLTVAAGDLAADLPADVRDAALDEPEAADRLAALAGTPALLDPSLAPTPPGPLAPTGTATPVATDPDAGADVLTVATLGDLTLVTAAAGVELIGFHESSNVDALAMTSAVPLVSHHPDVPTAAGADGSVIALPTRHRPGAPTSAVDVAVTPGTAVVAPVSGEVVGVGGYDLYGATRDLMVRIRPDDAPDLVVTAVHLEGAAVEVGDRVEAGRTPIADGVRELPFASQIDRFTTELRGGPAPHVHLEARRA